VDAEQAGQDGGGQVGGELEQRGGACLAGADAEPEQAFGELESLAPVASLAPLASSPAAAASALRCSALSDFRSADKGCSS